MGEAGCVAWMFHLRGLIVVNKAGVDEDALIEIALDAGADDVTDAGEAFEVSMPPDKFEAVRGALDKAHIPIAEAEVSLASKGTVTVTGDDAARTLKLLEELEDHDDIQNVASNFDISQEELERLSADKGLGWTLAEDFKDRFLTGSDELALVRSGLDDTMRTAYQAMREVWHGREGVEDLRLAAYIVAIERVARSYREKGL